MLRKRCSRAAPFYVKRFRSSARPAPATRCLEGISGGLPDDTRCRLKWFLAASMMAHNGPASPGSCQRWLPKWLPGTLLPSLMSEGAKTMSNEAATANRLPPPGIRPMELSHLRLISGYRASKARTASRMTPVSAPGVAGQPVQGGTRGAGFCRCSPRDLLARRQQHGIVRRRRTREQGHPAGQADEHQIEHPHRHKPAILPALLPLPQSYVQVSNLCPVWSPQVGQSMSARFSKPWSFCPRKC
jgi:hypothetical protein